MTRRPSVLIGALLTFLLAVVIAALVWPSLCTHNCIRRWRFRGWARPPQRVQTHEAISGETPIRVHYFGADLVVSVEYDRTGLGEFGCREDYEAHRVVGVYLRDERGWTRQEGVTSCAAF